MKTPEEIVLEKQIARLKTQITQLHTTLETLEKEIENLKSQNAILDTKAKQFRSMYFKAARLDESQTSSTDPGTN